MIISAPSSNTRAGEERDVVELMVVIVGDGGGGTCSGKINNN